MSNLKKNISLYSIICMICCSSCYYDVEENLYGGIACQSTNMSYSQDIQPILRNHCLSCHNAGSNIGNITLEGHDRLMIHIMNGSFLGAIKHQSNFSPMPQGNPKLSDCQIQKIESWINSGSPNN